MSSPKFACRFTFQEPPILGWSLILLTPLFYLEVGGTITMSCPLALHRG